VTEGSNSNRTPRSLRGGPPSSSADRSGTHPSLLTAGASVVLSPLDSLHQEEIRRLKVFLWLAAIFALGVLMALPFAKRDLTALVVMGTGFIVFLPFAAHLLLVMRNAKELPLRPVVAYGFACLYAGTAGMYCFGIFSPAAAALAFGLFFFSPSTSFRAALSIYVGGAMMHAVVATLILAGVWADHGLIRGDSLSLSEKIAVQVVVQAVYLASFLIGRATRKATLNAIEAHDHAVSELGQREDLLKEARNELEEALRAGKIGRYSDQQLGGFVLGGILGRGAMGEVYDATHVETGQPAAVKVLNHRALSEPDQVRRFMREARTASSIDSPHVCRVLEIGGLDAELPFIAMERLEGSDLAERLRVRSRLPLREVVKLVSAVADGLERAHALGIVHRDVNPRNLFMAASGGEGPVWKILDFGVSSVAGQETSEVVGTPAYMSPELARGRSASPRSDQFSLALVAYRALTGRAPFAGDRPPEILYRVVHEMPIRPSALARVPAEVDWVLAVALAKDEDERFASVTEFASALERSRAREIAPELRARAERLLAKTPWREAQ
jgi:tRNA A-37 threonylcarbamoyl transferase component Bud32